MPSLEKRAPQIQIKKPRASRVTIFPNTKSTKDLKSIGNKTMPGLLKDDLVTATSEAQEETKLKVLSAYKIGVKELNRQRHIRFLRQMLQDLPAGFQKLDASKPWIIYWNINALALLGDDITDLLPGVASTLLSCISPTGGIGGGYMQLAHLASTYAGITALTFCGPTVWDQLDRRGIYNWLLSLKLPDGSFKMSQGGEVDPRAAYCAIAIASLLNILTEELTRDVGTYIKSCQTYEGGFGNAPLAEAHGGYTFCALAALCIIGPPSETIKKYSDVRLLLKWLSARQHQGEGGFSGRTNKLVDGCYNHWIGGCWALVENALFINKDPPASLWDRGALVDWALFCCQDERHGGLRDKPGTSPDSYHSNYVLSGISGAQYHQKLDNSKACLGEFAFRWSSHSDDNSDNLLPSINPVHVVPTGVAENMHNYFKDKTICPR